MSIRPRFSREILAGTKTIELRRRAPQLQRGDVIVVYESSPTKAIVGWATVDMTVTDTPRALWARVSAQAGISRREYDEYFTGCSQATAIHLDQIVMLRSPIDLCAIRRRWPWLRPPQSFRYVHMSRTGAAISELAPAGARSARRADRQK